MIPYEQALQTLLERDPRVMILTAENRGHMRTLPDRIGTRFLDVGIAEQTMIGVAAGLALRGRVVLTHALASFITLRAFEFIRDDVGIPALPVIMVGMVPGILSDGNGPTHQAVDDVSLMRGIPNVGVFCPADEDDLILGLESVVLSGRPFYIRYNAMPAVVRHTTPFVIGQAEVVHGVHDGDRTITILSYGYMVRHAVEAAVLLEGRGFRIQVVNMRTLKPIDEDIILQAALLSDVVVTVEDHFRTGGLHSILAETLLRHRRTCHVLPIDIGDRWFRPGRLDDVLEYEQLTGRHVADRIITYLDEEIRHDQHDEH